ncbi:universal stress protein [Benzoatithermus flavus]|uniref:Universal stress protein n=1 Tax=Benzoatithermus flavus TaxID=3108223 RepID=A0ABU8XMY5_9PROT
MLTRILCATDGSRVSERAVAFAVELAKRCKAPLTFLTVITVSAETAARSPFWDTNLLDAGAAQTRHELAAAARLASESGLAGVDYATVQGRHIGKAIAYYAHEHGYDHIVMGSHGATGIERLMLGSVASDVVAAAHCPVTVVR